VANWREYQEKVARIFRELGCSAEVDKTVQGARATHQVDVWVRHKSFGLEQRWVIECKDWRAQIPKEKVLALKSLVDDVGADKGLIVASSGFQRGARKAAEQTNITLATIAELRKLVEEDVLRNALVRMERRTAKLKADIESCIEIVERTPHSGTSVWTAPVGVDVSKYLENYGKLAVLEIGFQNLRAGKSRLPVVFDATGNKLIFAKDLQEFLNKGEHFLAEVEEWFYPNAR
jgi:hypothetical protein